LQQIKTQGLTSQRLLKHIKLVCPYQSSISLYILLNIILSEKKTASSYRRFEKMGIILKLGFSN
jgi:hypothetical protein